MLLKSKILILFFGMIAIQSLAFGKCTGSCGGCTKVIPEAKKAAKKIDGVFLYSERVVSQHYYDKILPLLAAIKILERRAAVLTAQLEAIEKDGLFTERQIIQKAKELKNIYSTYTTIERRLKNEKN